MGVKLCHALRTAALALRRAQIEKTSAANGALCGHIADDEAVSGCSRDRTIQHQLHPIFGARLELFIPQKHDAGTDFRRGMMQANREPLTDRLFFRGEDLQ